MPRIQRPGTRCYVGVLADRAGGCIADGSADLAGVKVWARAQDSRPGIESGTQRGTLPNADILLQHHFGQRKLCSSPAVPIASSPSIFKFIFRYVVPWYVVLFH
ncbi:uncharacterized protein LOC119278226 [Triticum dicoccoides]|uniref:uncharacterized protein LOC119278226 n=1 Tax=Triticum dicoccoides TaxID=85692 RepID=UPI00189046D0|nr:uncharacterized protein LOC119278226 [Triticum dicoccoides]